MQQIEVYGTAWCPQVKEVLARLDGAGAAYRYHDIDADKKAAKAVYRLQRGTRRVPTLVMPDGTVLVEPTDDQLRDHLTATPGPGQKGETE
ncbi:MULTISPECIES: glutaredoxin family protein [Streptomyces]|uniref:Mycoredoxin n=1 Tax=Streptomyces radiopugnans TaxID=403935 RepID=A0A1H9KVH7_9ACTN|nr:glutaredoxin domain-containing protein [Streptomyces radiopugnans]SER03039.1 mycoredoxin [Streptomyces radiopugnans]